MKDKLQKWLMELNELSCKGKVIVLMVLGVVAGLLVGSWVWPGEPELKQAVNYEKVIATRVMEMLASNTDGSGISRKDDAGERWVYGVDVGLLMQYAAVAENEKLYSSLRGLVEQHFLIDPMRVDLPGWDREKLKDAVFVAWRYPTKRTIEKHHDDWKQWRVMNTAGEPMDATGTTESLRIAEGLWMGGSVFKREADKDMAVKVLRGYAAHAYEERGVWMIRNYINLQNGGGATNSYAIDYDADFVGAVAAQTGDEQLREVAEKTRELMLKLQTEAGLVHSIVQPEIETLMGPLPGPIYSPNRIEQLNNVVSVAERCAMMNREVAEKVLRFCMRDMTKLSCFYDVKTGDRVSGEGVERLGIETFAPLLRLTMRLNEREDYELVLYRLLWHVRKLAIRIEASHEDVSVYEMGEAILALRLGQIYYEITGTKLMLPGYVGRNIAKDHVAEEADEQKLPEKPADQEDQEAGKGDQSLPMIMPVQVEPPKGE